MAERFTLSGSFATAPSGGAAVSGAPGISATLDEKVVVERSHVDVIELTIDTPVAVGFGGVTNAHVVILKAIGGKVRARLTSADGAAQSVPVHPIAILISEDVPITAIDLTRVTGQDTTVHVTLAEKP